VEILSEHEALETSAALHARARAHVTAFEHALPPPEPFEALACDIARFQARAVEGYRRLCDARGVNVANLTQWEALPAVPTDAFKVARVSAFAESQTPTVFRTSGTTVGARGQHWFRTVSTYEAAAVAFGRYWLARDLAARRVPVVVLGPSPEEAPDSSLMHMCAAFVAAFGRQASASDRPRSDRATYVIDANGTLDLSTFDSCIAQSLASGEPMLVLGTSFAFVHLVDAVGKDTFALPAGSRVMQTGGYKGRSREVPADVLRGDLARIFDVDRRQIVAEYGMTELSSQFYEQTIFEPDAPEGVFAEPPWARVVPVHPDTLLPVADGDVGIAKVVDLMNVDSAVAVLTQDRVRRVRGRHGDRNHGPNPGGFELLGRAPGAPARGCSIAMDELLGGVGVDQALS